MWGRSLPLWIGVIMQALMLVLWAPPYACAEVPATVASHDPTQNVVLDHLVKMGAKAYFLGNRDGVDGWLLLQGKQVQLGYAADKNSLIIGMLFGPDGSSVSAEQLKAIVDTNPELKSLLAAAMQAGTKTPSASASASATMAAPVTAAPKAAAPASSPGERLVSELRAAPSVMLGQAAAAELLMVMDVNCPHCKATWRMLRDYVMSGKIKVRMIPVGEFGTEHETQGAVLLQAKDPLQIWDRHVAGDKAALAGAADPAHLEQIRSNDDLIIRWNIATTPYLVYRDRDGRIKIIQGEPSDPASLVNAIAP